MNPKPGAAAPFDSQVAEAEAEWLERFVAGPSRLRWADVPVQIGDPAPDFSLLDDSGAPRRLSEFWAERTTLVVFWRHFGCGCGLARAARLAEEVEGYRAAGAAVVVIGQGEPERARAYIRETGLDVPILCDPEFTAYHGYGLLDGTPAQILFDAPEEYWVHSRSTGERLGRQRRDLRRPIVDGPWLLPSEFVIDPAA